MLLSDCTDDLEVSETGPVDVVAEVIVVGVTTVVGVLFEVVVIDVSVVRVVIEVDVLVDVGVVVEAVTTDVVAADAEAPVPIVCLLWNIPSMIGISAVVEVVIRVRTAKARWAERCILLLQAGMRIKMRACDDRLSGVARPCSGANASKTGQQ